MNIRIYFSMMLATLSVLALKAQPYQPQKTGDKVPDIAITNFYNEPGRTEKISALYRNKLLILDFWGTWCAACLEALPKYNDLKRKYGDQIEILAVGYEPRESLDKLFKRNPSLNSPNYLTIFGEKALTFQLFPHKLLPHVVWIDQTGTVIAITGAEQVNDANITAAIASHTLKVRTKQDNEALSPAHIYQPFHLKDSDFVYRSIFTKGVAGAPSMLGFQGGADTGTVFYFNRAYMVNETIHNLYWDALYLGRRSAGNESGLRIETRDSLKYFVPKRAPQAFKRSSYKDYDDWADSNLYIYDLVLPKRVEENTIRRYMLEDLNRSLNLNGRYEIREVDCWVLSSSPGDRKSQPPDSAGLESFYFRKPAMKTLDGKGFTELLNRTIARGIVVYGIDHTIQVTLNTAMRPLPVEQINKIIYSLGYKLVPGKRKVPVYVVSEN